MTTRRTWWAPGFLLVPALMYAAVVVGPTLYSFYYSFTNWSALSGTSNFTGLANFRTMAADPYFWHALRNTVIWTAAAIVVPTVVALALAIGLARVRRFTRIIKSVFFLPLALSLVVVGQVWYWIYQPDGGLLNILLRAVGLSSLQNAWLADPSVALWAVIAAWCWQQVPLAMVIFLAGLTSVPQELTEASRVDGANGAQQLIHVVLPALRPAFTVVVTLALINSLKSFDIVYVMTQGGPFRSTETLAVLAYRTAFQTYDFGYGSAISVVLFLITLTAVGLFFAWNNRQERKYG